MPCQLQLCVILQGLLGKRGVDWMRPGTLQNLQLLLSAIGNVIDDNPNVEHITLPEIWEWLNDILGGME